MLTTVHEIFEALGTNEHALGEQYRDAVIVDFDAVIRELLAQAGKEATPEAISRAGSTIGQRHLELREP